MACLPSPNGSWLWHWVCRKIFDAEWQNLYDFSDQYLQNPFGTWGVKLAKCNAKIQKNANPYHQLAAHWTLIPKTCPFQLSKNKKIQCHLSHPSIFWELDPVPPKKYQENQPAFGCLLLACLDHGKACSKPGSENLTYHVPVGWSKGTPTHAF